MISRRLFLASAAVAGGSVFVPSASAAPAPDQVAQLLAAGQLVPHGVYELTDTLVLRDGDALRDVALVWRGPADRPMVRIEGAATLSGCHLDAPQPTSTFVQLAHWDGVQISHCIMESPARAPIQVF